MVNFRLHTVTAYGVSGVAHPICRFAQPRLSADCTDSIQGWGALRRGMYAMLWPLDYQIVRVSFHKFLDNAADSFFGCKSPVSRHVSSWLHSI